MIKKFALSLIASALLSPIAFAGGGIFDSFAIVNGQFYDLGASTTNPDYQGSFLGSFDAATGQIILGGQQKTFKNDGTDITGSAIRHRIYLKDFPSGGFNTLVEPFQLNLGTPGDQQWGTDVQGANGTDQSFTISLAGFAPGTYTLELFSLASSNGVNAPNEIFNNNGGENFTATFTVVPEPSTFALLGGPAILGAWMFIRRRRS